MVFDKEGPEIWSDPDLEDFGLTANDLARDFSGGGAFVWKDIKNPTPRATEHGDWRIIAPTEWRVHKTKTSPYVTFMFMIIIDFVQQTAEINDVSDGYIPNYN